LHQVVERDLRAAFEYFPPPSIFFRVGRIVPSLFLSHPTFFLSSSPSPFFIVIHSSVTKMAHERDIHPFAVPDAESHQFNLNEYEGLLNELNQQVRQKQPQDLLQFCSSFFLKKLELERSHHRNAGTNMFSMNSPFGNHGKRENASR
jgi:hypothetical protein